MGDRTILALDPGTKTGWSIRTPDGAHTSGVIDCTPGRHDSPGMRWVKLRAHLNILLTAYRDVELVVYEDVRRHAGTAASHIYGGMVATIQAWCVDHKMEHTAVPVRTVKKHATGKGNANKDAMGEAAAVRWPGYTFADDNEVDSRWIAETAASEVG